MQGKPPSQASRKGVRAPGQIRSGSTSGAEPASASLAFRQLGNLDEHRGLETAEDQLSDPFAALDWDGIVALVH